MRSVAQMHRGLAPSPLSRPLPKSSSSNWSRRSSPVQVFTSKLRSGKLQAAGALPPSVAETKASFTNLYPNPIPAIYSSVIQELIVQQHFIRYNGKYSYDPIFALGVTSAFDQILEDIGESGEAIFKAYIASLDEDAKTYRSDANALEEACNSLEGISGLLPGTEGEMNSVQSTIQAVAQKVEKGDFYYSKFFAIGIFRILELTGVKEPQALGKIVESLGVPQDSVNRDLKLYKGILSKVNAGKELMKEIMEREKKKTAERAAEKAAKAEVPVPSDATSESAET